ncbi:MAG: HDOD domain-containing protein [Chthoniobacterales bacterium]|nr:HDOD domain-containing protein [Chthoniobacterales bacterium]
MRGSSENLRERTEMLIRQIQTATPQPDALSLILKALHNPYTLVDRVVELINREPATAMRVLKIANSPYYGRSRKIETIEYAVLVLGFQEVCNVVSAFSLYDALRCPSDETFSLEEFWLHSCMTALVAQRLGSEKGMANLQMFFLCGLMHDVGLNIYHRYFHHAFREYAGEGGIFKGLALEKEEKQFGMNHAYAGKTLMEAWHFPAKMCEVVEKHHHPRVARIEEGVVHIADVLVNLMEWGEFAWDYGLKLLPGMVEMIGWESEAELLAWAERQDEDMRLQKDELSKVFV